MTGQITGASGPATPGLGFEFEVHSATPVPSAHIAATDLGISVGASILWRQDKRTAIGLDASYHYWPMSQRFKRDYNERFRQAFLNTIELGNGPWRMTARSATGVVRITPRVSGVLRPWFKVGGGVYQVDRRLKAFSGNAGFFSITMSDPALENDIGFAGGLGVDFFTGSRVRWGIGLNVDHVEMQRPLGEGLTAVSVGVHTVLGGR